ncbi:ABC-F family ATP-binding cassette domain-containing protein [Thermoflexibacter ruber]|nr:ABC-F family ATP-binding cassette domain-containing protein [Thermoflexibacter ruber]
MIAINNISFYFGSRVMYEEASLHIKPKDKIGLIGANGTGKSTLLRLIMGEYQPDAGSISKANDCTIGFLNQDLLSYDTGDSILSVAMEAFARQNELQHQIDSILHQIETNYDDKLIEKLGKLQEEFEHLGGYTIQSEAEAILEGLGFATKDLQRPLREFSGGWRMRVMLAKLLLMKPSLLMLDEPTNHLDLPSIQWIEEYLQTYEGAYIVVSHDREFLDNVAKTTVEVSQGKLNVYAGNYSFYLEERALRREIQQNAYENQQQQIRQMERFIERFKAKASKATQAQSRVKALEKMELIEAVEDENATVHFRFTFDQQPGRRLFEVKNLSKSYGDLHLLKNTDLVIERGDKIALIGANGRGKSTLLRIINGTEQFEGESKLGYNVKIAMYAQHQLEVLNLENTIIDELKESGTQRTETELRTILGCFLFTGEDVFKKIKVLSGGEKSRVALALTLISASNFLLLDEPTNHLDMQSVNILVQALQQYEGSFVVVSHDRHFVSQIANKIWWIENQELKEYLGTYEEFKYWDSQRQKNIINSPKDNKPETQVKTQQNNSTSKNGAANNNTSDEVKKELKKVQKQLEDIENQISALEEEKKNLELDMTKPEIFNDGKKLASTNEKFKQTSQQLEKLSGEWEKVMLHIEELNMKA